MKKYIRKIVVGGENYTWSSGRNNCDGDGSNLITIWKNKKQIHQKLIRGNIQITPSLVRKVIEVLNNHTSKEDLMRQIKGNKQLLNLAEHHNEPEAISNFKQIIAELEELLVNRS